jgi:uncharacterized membrane protein (DUF485 family)
VDQQDWQGVEESPVFERLTTARRSLIAPLLAVWVVWFGGYLILTAYASDFMGETIYPGFTVGYLLAISQIAVAWLLAWISIRHPTTVIQPLRERAAEGRER